MSSGALPLYRRGAAALDGRQTIADRAARGHPPRHAEARAGGRLGGTLCSARTPDRNI